MNNAISLLWLAAVLVAIPVVLWLLKRTPMLRGQHAPGAPRTVASMPLSPSHRVVTVEVGLGEERQWLVLGVGPQGIQTLHTMAAGHELLSDSPTLALAATSSKHTGSPGTSHAQPGKAAATSVGIRESSSTFSQLIHRLRSPAARPSSTEKRGHGKPPRAPKPGDHER